MPSLSQVLQLLLLASRGLDVDLPDPRSILPYIGLFSVLVLKPKLVQGCVIRTLHQPPPSIISDNQFVPAPGNTPFNSRNIARIFDVQALEVTDPPLDEALIPLSDDHPDFEQRRYWRLPLKTEAVLAALLDSTEVGFMHGDPETKEIRLCIQIKAAIMMRRHGYDVRHLLDDSDLDDHGNGLDDSDGCGGVH
jgi:hypothetical protein